MPKLRISLVSPSSTFEESQLNKALLDAERFPLEIVASTKVRKAFPSFLNGGKEERLRELIKAETLETDAIWCARGGCGVIDLWHDYEAGIYEHKTSPLIGYSDISLLHFMRFHRAGRIGIHGPVFFDLGDEARAHFGAIRLLIDKRAHQISYPPLKRLNHFVPQILEGELIAMNLILLECLSGCVDPNFFRAKILAIEEINEPHYRIFRAINHLKNAGLLAGLRALIIGQFNLDRAEIIKETMLPLAEELGIPIFDWPFFGHEKPNWPLLFGAKTKLRLIDNDLFTLRYSEQHDHASIVEQS